MEGDGFLYKMVRHLVGALLTVGRGKLSLEAFQAALDKGVHPGEPAARPAVSREPEPTRLYSVRAV